LVRESYRDKVLHSRLTRRRALAATCGSVAAAALLAACGGDDDDSANGTNGARREDPGTPQVGGTLIWQGYGDPGGGLELIRSRNAGVVQLASLTHDALMDFGYGLPEYPGISIDVVPSLAQALPEVSPDRLTITFQLKPARFHNGRDLTSEDVAWTYETLAFANESAYRNDFTWFDRVEAPDPSTFVIHAKFPNADALESLAFKNHGAILAREHHESGAAERSLMGSGPFLFGEYNPPLITTYRRNPDYMTDQGKPYFESIERLGTSDSEKKVADIIARQVQLTYWFPPEERDRILQQRRDLQVFGYPEPGGGNLYIRNDVAPFNDKRVRQALSMGFDRQLLINATTAGEGRADQALSRAGEAWEFRGPEDLPRSELYELNVQEARRLMEAANVTLPLRATIPTWNATVVGQKWVDVITSVSTQLRNNGILDATLQEETFGQFAPRFTGQYDQLHWGPNTTSTLPQVGLAFRDKYWSPPEGVRPPTLNINHVNIPELNDVVDRQLGEFDRDARISLFRRMEEILSEEMVHVPGITSVITYLMDPSVRNAQMPRDAYNGATPWMKHWFFGEA
jgi:peptide/nickel transport system substrate-binding protein